MNHSNPYELLIIFPTAAMIFVFFLAFYQKIVLTQITGDIQVIPLLIKSRTSAWISRSVILEGEGG